MGQGFLATLAQDVFHADAQVRALALTTVCQLGFDSVDSAPGLGELLAQLERAAATEGDVRFLARKGVNHVRWLQVELGIVPPPPPVQPADEGDRTALLQALGDVDDPRALATTVSRLAEVGRPEDVPLVAPLLQHADPRVRSNSAEFVGQHAPGRACVELLMPLLSDDDNRVRATAAVAVGSVGQTDVVTCLACMLQDDRVSMRESAVYALGKIRQPGMVELLLHALQDTYEAVRLRAARGLAAHRDPRALAALREARLDLDPMVAEAATMAYGAIAAAHPEAVAAMEQAAAEPGPDPAPEPQAEHERQSAPEAPASPSFPPPDPEPKQKTEPETGSAPEAAPAPQGSFEYVPGVSAMVEVPAEPEAAFEYVPGASVMVEVPAEPLTKNEPAAAAAAEPAAVPAAASDPSATAKPATGARAKVLEKLGSAAQGLAPKAVPKPATATVQGRMQGLDRDGLTGLLEAQLTLTGEAVFKLLRRGELQQDRLKVVYYDVVKYADFLRKHKEKMLAAPVKTAASDGGILSRMKQSLGLAAPPPEENEDLKQLERLEDRIRDLYRQLGRSAVAMIRAKELDFAGANDLAEAIDVIEAGLKTAGPSA